MKPIVIILTLTTAAFLQDSPSRTESAATEREYREALREHPDDPLLHYNLGTVLVLAERYDDAHPHLEAARVGDSTLVAAASYNLGATDLEPAFADTALPDRDERLRRAIEAYKQALLAAPSDQDAKWNLELARRLLERESPPASGGGGGGSGSQGQPMEGSGEPTPTPAAGGGPQPEVSETEAENLLRAARERELEMQRELLRKPQPPGPIRP
jgi:Ca-activated chloride channel homolog